MFSPCTKHVEMFQMERLDITSHNDNAYSYKSIEKGVEKFLQENKKNKFYYILYYMYIV